MNWPDWWEWELEFSPHLAKRMAQRDFTEIDLRGMLHRARRCRPDAMEERWVIETRHRRQGWEVIVEPDSEARLLVVITAYPT